MKETTNSKERTLKLVQIALLIATVVVLQIISGSIPPIGGFISITLTLIPIVMGSVMYGPWVGLLLGAVFGIIVAILDPTAHALFALNPWLSVILCIGKGALAGLAAGAIALPFKKTNRLYWATIAAAITAPTVNTLTFLLGMRMFFYPTLQSWVKPGYTLISYLLIFIVCCNYVPELIINIAFSPAGARIIRLVNKGKLNN